MASKIATTSEQHLAMIWRMLSEGTKQVLVSSFGAGPCEELLSILPAIDSAKASSRVLIGVRDALHARNIAWSIADMQLAQLRRLELRLVPDLHMKLWASLGDDNKWRAIIGGRNLTGSKWVDVSVRVDSKLAADCAKHFSKVWSDSAIDPRSNTATEMWDDMQGLARGLNDDYR